jgi:hypothetical protein
MLSKIKKLFNKNDFITQKHISSSKEAVKYINEVYSELTRLDKKVILFAGHNADIGYMDYKSYFKQDYSKKQFNESLKKLLKLRLFKREPRSKQLILVNKEEGDISEHLFDKVFAEAKNANDFDLIKYQSDM